MNLADLDLFTAEIRAIQSMYPEAHEALLNWGRWSRDRYGIGPRDARCSTWQYAKPDAPEEYGEDVPEALRTNAEVKAEGPDREPYDERLGVILDERMHGPGGLGVEIRRVLRVTYCSTIPEPQLPRECGCLPHAFKERLSAALAFAQRFA